MSNLPFLTPIEYQHCSNVINWLIGLLLVFLLIMAILEHFSIEIWESTSESSNLLGSEVKRPVGIRQKKWNELLQRNVENLIPFFLTKVFLERICFSNSTLTLHDNFHAIIYSVVGLQFLFIFARLIHAFGHVIEFRFLRTAGFFISALVNIALSIFTVVLSFVGGWPSFLVQSGDTFNLAVRIIAILIAIITIKIYFVLFLLHKVKYYDENTLLEIRLENMARNDVEAFVPLCGMFPIWIAVFYFEILSASGIFPQYNFESVFILCFSILIIFVICRLLHTIFYYLAMQPYRTISYYVALICITIFGLAAYGVYINYYRMMKHSPHIPPDLRKIYYVPLAFFTLTIIELIRSFVVSILTIVYRISLEKRFLNIEDKMFVSDDGYGNVNIEEERKPDVISLLPTISEKLQRIHLLDTAFQMLFFYIIYLMSDPLLNEQKIKAIIALGVIFVAFRFLPFISDFAITRTSISSYVKIVGIMISLAALFVLLMWFFIARVIAINNTPTFAPTNAPTDSSTERLRLLIG